MHPSGIAIDGATPRDGKLVLNDGETVRTGHTQVRWIQKPDSTLSKPASTSVNLPVYLNSERGDVLFTVDLPFEAGVESLVAIRAVCLTAGE